MQHSQRSRHYPTDGTFGGIFGGIRSAGVRRCRLGLDSRSAHLLEGPDGILPFLRERVKEQKYAVVVVAEGAGEDILGVSEELDAGGNRALPKIGEFLRDEVARYFASFGETATIKYIDLSYTVRSVPANSADSLYCMQLAQNAVHGAMAGLTGFSTVLVGNAAVYLPIPQLVSTSPRQMNPYGRTWERILATTGQPNTLPKRDNRRWRTTSLVQCSSLPYFDDGLLPTILIVVVGMYYGPLITSTLVIRA